MPPTRKLCTSEKPNAIGFTYDVCFIRKQCEPLQPMHRRYWGLGKVFNLPLSYHIFIFHNPIICPRMNACFMKSCNQCSGVSRDRVKSNMFPCFFFFQISIFSCCALCTGILLASLHYCIQQRGASVDRGYSKTIPSSFVLMVYPWLSYFVP